MQNVPQSSRPHSLALPFARSRTAPRGYVWVARRASVLLSLLCLSHCDESGAGPGREFANSHDGGPLFLDALDSVPHSDHSDSSSRSSDRPPVSPTLLSASFAPTCPPPSLPCATGCADLRVDARHCGACDHRCDHTARCTAGRCVPIQRSCPNSERGCGVVRVDAATFTMGDDRAYRGGGGPGRVSVGGFLIDAHEVTVSRLERFFEAGAPVPSAPVAYPGGRRIPMRGRVTEPERGGGPFDEANYGNPGREFFPANFVGWPTAFSFCVWDGGRLPTEAEWELAARTSESYIYPWGSSPPSDAHLVWSGSDLVRLGTTAVDHGAADHGIFHLAGNVSEYVADAFMPYRFGCWNQPPSDHPMCLESESGQVTVRGGHWASRSEPGVRAATRDNGAVVDHPTAWDFSLIGFRCVRDER